jgi:ribosomal protein L37AE/L43A
LSCVPLFLPFLGVNQSVFVSSKNGSLLTRDRVKNIPDTMDSEDTTRHDCSICGEEFSCGNKDSDGNWVCEDCGGCESDSEEE